MGESESDRERWDVSDYLYFLDHLLAEGADFGGYGDGHVLKAAVLAAHAVEGAGTVRHPTAVQVRLGGALASQVSYRIL